MPRPRPNDDAGNAIDPNKDLASFLQRAAPPSDPMAETPAPEPAWKTVTFDDAEDPDVKGKSGADVLALLKTQREEAEAARQRATQSEIELARFKQTQDQEALTRRILAEREQQQAAPPKEPEVDPRLAKRDQMWLDGNYQEWHQLNDEIQSDSNKRAIAEAVERTKREIKDESRTTSSREQGTAAYWQAQKYLESQGVPANAFHERARAVLGEVTWEQSPYFANGGPLNANNIVGAFYKLFGQPTAAAPAPAPAASPSPVPSASAAPPTPPAPPGSGRPAPAAAAPREPTARLTAEQRRDSDQLAKSFGYDPEKFAARRRARIEKERDAHA